MAKECVAEEYISRDVAIPHDSAVMHFFQAKAGYSWDSLESSAKHV